MFYRLTNGHRIGKLRKSPGITPRHKNLILMNNHSPSKSVSSSIMRAMPEAELARNAGKHLPTLRTKFDALPSSSAALSLFLSDCRPRIVRKRERFDGCDEPRRQARLG
jgi:hypothetical protein